MEMYFDFKLRHKRAMLIEIGIQWNVYLQKTQTTPMYLRQAPKVDYAFLKVYVTLCEYLYF